MAILTRGDVRSEIHKELDLQIATLTKFQSQPGVDAGRLGALLGNLVVSREEVDAIGTQFMQTLKDCEFLSSIKHRSSIPGRNLRIRFAGIQSLAAPAVRTAHGGYGGLA